MIGLPGRRHPVAGAMVVGGIASNRAEQKQQQQMYQQQTQAQINSAQAEAAAANQQVQQLQMEQQKQQQAAASQQQQQPIYVYTSSMSPQQPALTAPPPAISPNMPVLEAFSDHLVDENSPAMKEHHIISVPKGARVRLVNGSLEHGLNPPYQDYVIVDYNGKTGKVSRLVLCAPQC